MISSTTIVRLMCWISNARRRLLLLTMLSLAIFSLPRGVVAQSVVGQLGKDTAWTGEAVPLIITLYSPGPFSGTASFELPELPQTVFLKIGRPLVGSEEVNGESLITQRHEFRLVTYQQGNVTIPPIAVRFAGKESFTGPALERSGNTEVLSLTLRRPDVKKQSRNLLTTTGLDVSQSWRPTDQESLFAGDVVVRTITRKAKETSAMLLPPLDEQEPDGIKIYDDVQEVADSTERGAMLAKRVDVLKYQFQRSGTFTLPTLRFMWWDPKTEQLKEETLPGREIVVSDSPQAAERQPEGASSSKGPSSTVWGASVAAALLLSAILWRWRRWLMSVLGRLLRNRRPRQDVARQQLHAACKQNDPHAAWNSLLEWTVAMDSAELLPFNFNTSPAFSQLREQQQLLACQLYSADPPHAEWIGAGLWDAFTVARKSLVVNQKPPSSHTSLPPLNPSR